jgi:transcriptional regulator with XRE-family HTH domain
LAHRSGVSQYLIVDFEHSRRTPTPDQLQKLLAVLGQTDPVGSASGLPDEALTALAACLAWTHEIPLAALAQALALTVAEVRDGIEQTRERLRTVGLEVFVDHRRARVAPVSWCERPLRAVSSAPLLSAADRAVLTLLHEHDGARLTDIDPHPGSAFRKTLASLLDRGLVGCASGGPVADRMYWITDQGIRGAADWALKGTPGPESG